MDGFMLLMGHLVGDYILQNDWMARWKSATGPGPRPKWTVDSSPESVEEYVQKLRERNDATLLWEIRSTDSAKGDIACTIHCLLYTLAVWLFSFWWLPWWGALIVFATHWPIDRFRLASKYMKRSGQTVFLTGVFAPWSAILTDQIFHLLVLALVAVLAGRVG